MEPLIETQEKEPLKLRTQLLLLGIALVALLLLGLLPAGKTASSTSTNTASGTSSGNPQLVNQVSAEVLPKQGYQTKIVLGDAIVKLVQNGVIDPTKLAAIYKSSGGLPSELKNVLTATSDTPILLTPTNANYYVNLLWAIGLSNHMAINDKSPINGTNVSGFASTGGWTLGKNSDGGTYFNKFSIVPLTPDEEARVLKIAENTYRPCCDNPTFFQDCNHGSAALALIEIGVSDGLSDAEIYQTVLEFNSFWFPQQYVETSLYFKAVKDVDWKDVDPKLLLSKDYSSLSGWTENVDAKVQKLDLLPQEGSGQSCGV